MKITLNEITFTKEEMTSFLQENGYKIETHKSWGGLVGVSYDTNKEYAIPTNEEFDVNKHKVVEITFESLIKNGVKKFLLSLV